MDANESSGYLLWDWPVRLIHWLIALLLPASWWTAEQGYYDVHQWLGLSILVAVLTRLIWGFIGSPQARFTDFVRGPMAVLRYFRGQGAPAEASAEPDKSAASTPGHNPAGGWSVLMLWTLLILQVFTGTVNSDDVLFNGPFYYVFDSSVRDQLAALHEILFKLLLAFVVLHVAMVLYYERIKKQRLLLPMIKGKAEGRHGTGPAQPLYKALLVAVLMAGILWGLIEIAPEPPPTFFW
jgi:cytochrome b